MATLGWDVLATDAPLVHETVLGANIRRNRDQLPQGSGTVESCALDWFGADWLLPSAWTAPVDIVFTADTIYAPELIAPLWQTVRRLCNERTQVLVCVERRDPALIERALEEAQDAFGFSMDRVPAKKLARSLKKGGVEWEKEDWEGVELWKLQLQPENDVKQA